ncbi:FAD/NAD(P)-binding domain-containing protein [Setomelanomma holmii]|uniref:FAD/NAD(P)-binding domain-containing protein n=1 Tax=Setomelanomma holmii TaxID=210430 RepID=A0A9P4LE65_9PLEO|nr:FAD/NAD(P)-binding domain-containing protein [Setomelanomma holmii]
MTSEQMSLRARSIAIVGAGPSGVIVAKYLRAEKAFDKIVLFEQRSRPGGIWTYTGDQRDENLLTIPQTSPRGKNQDPEWKAPETNGVNSVHHGNNIAKRKGEMSFLSPMYEKLETNIPRGLMGFQDLNWPQDSQLFPTHETVLKYIDDYGKDVQDLVQYETQVINAEPVSDTPNSSWKVRTENLRTAEEQEGTFDALIVANGHFIVPYIPDIEGIREWDQKYPGGISHSKYYRRPEEFEGKKTIVIGNSASASHGSGDPRRHEVPPIARFTPDNRGVVFEDGTIESNIHAILFATGYFYSLPFLDNVTPALITDGSHVDHTYQHLFYSPKPTLSFLALNQRVIPFPLAEAQASVLARVYSGRLSLPSLAEMQKCERDVIDDMGDGRNFHLLPFPKDGNYINEMSHWALSAPLKDGLANGGKGKVPPIWGEWEFWCRENFPAIRKAFGALGEKRHQVRSLEEVGFSYEGSKRETAKSEGKLI